MKIKCLSISEHDDVLIALAFGMSNVYSPWRSYNNKGELPEIFIVFPSIPFLSHVSPTPTLVLPFALLPSLHPSILCRVRVHVKMPPLCVDGLGCCYLAVMYRPPSLWQLMSMPPGETKVYTLHKQFNCFLNILPRQWEPAGSTAF